MKIDVGIIAPDLVEVTETPSRRARWLGEHVRNGRARLVDGRWKTIHCWCIDCSELVEVSDSITAAIEHAFADLDARRAAETAHNYQAAAQRGEYPIR